MSARIYDQVVFLQSKSVSVTNLHMATCHSHALELVLVVLHTLCSALSLASLSLSARQLVAFGEQVFEARRPVSHHQVRWGMMCVKGKLSFGIAAVKELELSQAPL